MVADDTLLHGHGPLAEVIFASSGRLNNWLRMNSSCHNDLSGCLHTVVSVIFCYDP